MLSNNCYATNIHEKGYMNTKTEIQIFMFEALYQNQEMEEPRMHGSQGRVADTVVLYKSRSVPR